MTEWILPASPDSPVYRDVIEDIRLERNPQVKRAKFRAICEADYWFFLKFAHSFGNYKIKDAGHAHKGGFWIDEPFVFNLARTFQKDIDTGESRVFYNLPRYYFKTSLLTQAGSVWLLLKNFQERIAILTYKVDATGEQIFGGAKMEMENNKVLHAHWPDRLTPRLREYPYWTQTAIMLLNSGPAQEPSLSIHSLDRQPTSGHYTKLFFDDPVVKETVLKEYQIQKTIQDLRTATALRSEDTQVFYIGTIWDIDDPWMQLEREDFFSRRDHISCYNEAGEPILRSRKFLKDWERDMGGYMFSCLMLGNPTPRGERRFLQEWIRHYENKPQDERKGKSVDIFTDFAEGVKDGDYHCFRVVGFGKDRKRYNLDLWREKGDLVRAFDGLFNWS